MSRRPAERTPGAANVICENKAESVHRPGVERKIRRLVGFLGLSVIRPFRDIQRVVGSRGGPGGGGDIGHYIGSIAWHMGLSSG